MAPTTTTRDEWDDLLASWETKPASRLPSPEAEIKNKKRKSAAGDGDDALGLSKEVEVTKKPRVPKPKLDEKRLLSDQGIPKLRTRARDLKLRGKGHEWSDAARLLSWYQRWLDDLFPKAKFVDALSMVEKAGHKKVMKKMRMEWIDEGRPRTSWEHGERNVGLLDEEENVFGATPEAAERRRAASWSGDVPEDDLEALMAEQDAVTGAGAIANPTSTDGGGVVGNGPDGDVDVMMAEADSRGAQGTFRTATEESSQGPLVAEEVMAQREGLF